MIELHGTDPPYRAILNRTRMDWSSVATMTETDEQNSSNRVSLNISLSSDQKTKLGEVAKKHHNGNRSALIRSAVYLYERVMESPEDLPAPTKIKVLLEDLQTDVNELDSTVESLPNELRSPGYANLSGTHREDDGRNDQGSLDDSSEPNQDEIGSSITSVLQPREIKTLTLNDLSEETDWTESEFRPVLNEQVTLGIVGRAEADEDEMHYWLETDDAFEVEL